MRIYGKQKIWQKWLDSPKETGRNVWKGRHPSVCHGKLTGRRDFDWPKKRRKEHFDSAQNGTGPRLPTKLKDCDDGGGGGGGDDNNNNNNNNNNNM